jgi:hypothetical protein
MIKLVVSMSYNRTIGKNTLSLIANGSYEFKAPDDNAKKPSLTNAEYLQLFELACLHARELLSIAQDPASRIGMGGTFKKEGRTEKLDLDARRFTKPVPMEVFDEVGNELFSRVTVTEHQQRSSPNDRFHPIGYGAVAVVLFVNLDSDIEHQLHSAAGKQDKDSIGVTINNLVVPPASGMPHIISLLEQTRAALS